MADLTSAVYVLHEEPLAPGGQPTGQPGGALTKIGIVGGVFGIVPLGSDAFGNPHLRQLEFGVISSRGEGPAGLSGVPVALAFDDQLNLGALANAFTTFSAGSPLATNGKTLVRNIGGGVLPVSHPTFLFLAVPGSAPVASVVDVLDVLSRTRVDTDPFLAGTQSISVPGVSGLMNYFSQ